MPSHKKKEFLPLLVCMAIVYAVICYGSVRSGWLFYFDDEGTYQRGPLYFAIYLFSYISMLISSVHALVRAAKIPVPARKRRMYTIAAFAIAPMAASFLQWGIGRYPMIIPGLCIGFMFVFISLQDDSINLDALTGLNNRKSMDRYLEEIRGRVSELTPYYVFILDADDFKSVNDSQGHIEGDRALRRIAGALRTTGDLFNGFIARFGGDEFIAVVSGQYLKDPELFVETMNEQLAQVVARTKLGYPLSVSVGYARYASSEARTQELIGRADEMLYQKKKERA